MITYIWYLEKVKDQTSKAHKKRAEEHKQTKQWSKSIFINEKYNTFKAYIMVFLIRGIYSYKVVSEPSWVIQAFCKCEGSSLMFVVETKLPMNCDKISPKCWEAFTKF